MHISSRALAVYATSLSLLLSGCSGSSDSSTSTSAASSASGPAISLQPASAIIPAGSNSVLSVVATGSGLTYQWYLGGAAIADATAATYTATEAGTYYVVVTSSAGSVTSANAVITVSSAPVITAQPSGATILTGTSQTLSVTADGLELGYQWYKDGTAIDGATRPTYAASAAGSYTVAITNTAGTTTSSAAVIAVSSSVTAPSINVQPVAQTVNAGTSATLWVTVNGVSPSYQWYRNDVAIAGATDRIYKINTTNASSAGNYKVVVTNTAGAVTSASVALTVNVVSAGANTPAVVNAANAFLATLSADQKTVASSATSSTTVLFDYALANANQWTNLPGSRHGLRLNASTLSAAQLAAANLVIAKALSANGITLLNELRAADQVLAGGMASGGGAGGGGTMPGGATPPTDGTFTPPTDGTFTPPTDGAGAGAGGAGGTGGTGFALDYGSDLYSIAFVGTPSATSPWILQIAGHHLAYNITYNTGKVSATPNFVGVEPPNWTVGADGVVDVKANASSAGKQHAPMEKQRAAVYNLAQAIYADSASSAAAKLPGTFTDVIMGASGNSDGNFKSLVYPTSGRGLQYSAMNARQQTYVRAAIEAWVNTQASDVAATLLGAYLADDALANTYVAYGVGQNGVKADFSAYPNAAASPLEAQHSYIRIDGPRVWIEFVVQQGVVYGTDIHYHTIWRDKTNDYGGSF
ncbi:Immunoglobulin domain-containing protein [Duganella sp. CF402]|uniref:DUF3500 domain-containing protein n=1 Tax=unclassified Duganella TaxID=2636909 RepID=UPI0008AE57C7|nr:MULTISPECIES: DUF3500 domain-containing protein [unclassified Duganella]RZT06137.1 Ig-like domain-containing protein [Duganella sp. BK701]SEM74705.1 Immunoglobulin domain-containing protein [Duganella sp. CF402]